MTGLSNVERVFGNRFVPVMTNAFEDDGFIDNAEIVLSMIRNDPAIRQADTVEATGMSLSKVKRIIANLRDSGRVTRVGSNRNGRWIVGD